MEENKKIIIQSDEKMNKNELEQVVKKLEEDIKTRRDLSVEEKKQLLKAKETLENEKVRFYGADESLNLDIRQMDLVRDVLDDKVSMIISRDAKRFSKISSDQTIPGMIAAKCSVYTLDGKINTISKNEKFKMQIINAMNEDYKRIADERSRMGERLKIKEVKIWILDDLEESEIEKIYKKAQEKMEKSREIQKGGMFRKLKEKIEQNEIIKINKNELNTKLEQKYTNCIIIKNKEFITKAEEEINARQAYNKNVIICLIDNDDIKFYAECSTVTLTRNSLEKFNKKIKKHFIYAEI